MTEGIFGVDLVREQIRVAAGLEMSFTQGDLQINGHAIEVRINAEKLPNFSPCPGKITQYHAPGGLGVRMDSALYDGYKIPPYYDSLIGKLIVHGPDRAQAIARARSAVQSYVILGVTTNTGYLDAILAHPDFASGDVSTGFLAEQADTLTAPGEDVSDLLMAAAALWDERLVSDVMQIPEMHRKMGGWRN